MTCQTYLRWTGGCDDAVARADENLDVDEDLEKRLVKGEVQGHDAVDVIREGGQRQTAGTASRGDGVLKNLKNHSVCVNTSNCRKNEERTVLDNIGPTKRV